MSRSDAFITVYCDGKGCDREEEVQLTAIAGNAWDERYVAAELRRAGWVVSDGNEYCDGCAWQASADRSDKE